MKKEHAGIETREDEKRGCGWRKPGGYYLMSKGLSMPCGKMPIPLDVCPCCNAGVKFTRGWQWVNLKLLTEKSVCHIPAAFSTGCHVCPLGAALQIERAGLLFIGEKFYTPQEFTDEAARLGVSRRVQAIPRDFKKGETWIAMASVSAVTKKCPDCADFKLREEKCKTCKDAGTVKGKGIFHLFRPETIEYVVTGKESKKQIDALIAKGITPVKVIRKEGGK